jgi:type II secretory pathway pseudopilin PulG
MHAPTSKHTVRCAGYSLVEVTLALLVVAIGLTATFALFPEGLRASRSAVNDNEVAMFAEYVFTTLDLAAADAEASWGIADTDPFQTRALSEDADHLVKKQLVEGRRAVFYWIPQDYDLGGFDDYGAARAADFWTTAFTYELEIGNTARTLGLAPSQYAVLRVWPGEYLGSIQPSGDPRVFYREILPNR